MAKDNDTPAAPAKKGGKKNMILAIGLFFLIAILAAAVVFLMSKGQDEEGEEADE